MALRVGKPARKTKMKKKNKKNQGKKREKIHKYEERLLICSYLAH